MKKHTTTAKKCKGCGGKIRSDNTSGYCSDKNPACARARWQQRYKALKQDMVRWEHLGARVRTARGYVKIYRRWTDQENAVIRRRLGTTAFVQIAQEINRSLSALRGHLDKNPELKAVCELCGGPLHGSARVGVCSRKTKCRKEAKSRLYKLPHNRTARKKFLAEYYKRPVVISRIREARRASARRSPNCVFLPRSLIVGANHYLWAGGKIAYCVKPGCGSLAGRRGPESLKRNRGRAYCAKHRKYQYKVHFKGAPVDEEKIKQNLAFVY